MAQLISKQQLHELTMFVLAKESISAEGKSISELSNQIATSYIEIKDILKKNFTISG